MRAILSMLVSFSFTLVACGDGLSKSNLGQQIEKSLEDSHVCFALTNNSGQFPVSMRLSPFGDTSITDPILAALVKGGFMSAAVKEDGSGFFDRRRYLVLDLTDEGKGAEVWDPQRGACIGRRGGVEVVNWSEPVSNGMTMVTRINYTWEIVDTPKWVEREAFSGIPGMTRPVEAMAMAQKMSDGWKVINIHEEGAKMLHNMFQ